MTQSFADFYKVDPNLYASTGALDPILNIDTRLFIDPCFLRVTTTPELQESYNKVLNHFENVLTVITKIKKADDIFWRKADAMLTFPEVNGLCIGYSSKGNRGSGMGPVIRAQLLDSATQIVNAGVDDPVLFELVGAFEEGIGCDRISDMIAKIIIYDLVEYTQRVCKTCSIPLQELPIGKNLPSALLPVNPLDGKPIILTPKEILNDLPVADDFSDIQYISAKNHQLREEINKIIGDSWGGVTLTKRKEITKNTFISHPDVLREILDEYRKSSPELYDFENDPAGEVIWYPVAKRISNEIKLSLSLKKNPSRDDVYEVVLQICEHFRALIEDNQLCELLYDKDGDAKHESAAQLLFFGIANAYCKANNLDLSPESDSGRGPVDFKISSGYEGRVLVELKLTSNTRLLHGFNEQLPIYQKAENTTKGILLVIDNGGATQTRLDMFNAAVRSAGINAPQVIFVDAIIKPSASKA